MNDEEYKLIDKIDIDDYTNENGKFNQYAEETKRCWLASGTLYFLPAMTEDLTYTLRYYSVPTALTSLDDEIPIPSQFHLDLAMYVTGTIKPIDDFVILKRNIENKIMRIHRNHDPERTVKLWFE